ncbi:phosphatidylserine/phosphatidylglycerophosphate/cardiolipin synthase family protein [Sphingomonas daechungensis]|uniref:phosphatidylserine/phosphatidylglycerophosphate/ cardiolipin synthase family protein n=1 Tax=Sphingomonas daechungensis TaxID=1176646 RepID=UPI0037846410
MADQPKPATATADRVHATVGGDRLELIESGTERIETLLQIIAEAKESVRILFYIFDSDDSGRRVRDALVEAAGRGATVHLLVDGFGCSTAEPDFFKPLKDAGGDFCVFNPRYGSRYLVRNHQKLVVADDRVGLIGGANIQDSYLTDEGDKRWRDLWLRIEGPAMASAGEYFDSVFRWTKRKTAKLRQLRRIVARHTQHRGVLQWKFSGPLSRKHSWPAALSREMSGAKEIGIIAAYFSPPWSVMRRLGRIARGGGKVQIITASKSDNTATIGAARHTYSRLLRRGIEMFEYRPAKLHTKLAIVDDVVHIGSANLDFRSLYINLEIMLRIDDANFAASMRRYFDGERADSEQITLALHRKRATLWRRFKWTVSHWLVTSMDYTVTKRLNFNEG